MRSKTRHTPLPDTVDRGIFKIVRRESYRVAKEVGMPHIAPERVQDDHLKWLIKDGVSWKYSSELKAGLHFSIIRLRVLYSNDSIYGVAGLMRTDEQLRKCALIMLGTIQIQHLEAGIVEKKKLIKELDFAIWNHTQPSSIVLKTLADEMHE